MAAWKPTGLNSERIEPRRVFKTSMSKDLPRISKFLSFVLRHRPEAIGLTLDQGGWVPIDELLRACADSGRKLTLATLIRIVDENDKNRFVIRDGLIRANQGHSLQVDLGLEPGEPPAMLFHGTATRFLDAILREGLKSGGRQFVHLSVDRATATTVGSRHGKPVVLTIAASTMQTAGHSFYLAENGVWLTVEVPPEYISE